MTSIGIPPHKALPEILPIFPLSGALLLPQGNLPLNIFEERYIAMIDDAIRSNRLIGMVQPNGDDLYKIGCAGKISAFQETDDGRYVLNLTGVSRFKLEEEVEPGRGYRRARANWKSFENDGEAPTLCLDMDRDELSGLLRAYFQKNGMDVEWDMIEIVPDQKLMTALAMICPFELDEKQALLEAPTCKDRADVFVKLLRMSVKSTSDQTSFH